MVAVGPAALLVDERVRDRVRADVGDAAQREGQELLEPLLALVVPSRCSSAWWTSAWQVADVRR